MSALTVTPSTQSSSQALRVSAPGVELDMTWVRDGPVKLSVEARRAGDAIGEDHYFIRLYRLVRTDFGRCGGPVQYW